MLAHENASMQAQRSTCPTLHVQSKQVYALGYEGVVNTLQDYGWNVACHCHSDRSGCGMTGGYLYGERLLQSAVLQTKE